MKQTRKLIAVSIILTFLTVGCGPGKAPVQGADFAVLTQHAEGYEQARSGLQLSFPRDHGPHPGYRVEWWYLTANLSDPAGHAYGAQWTLFRLAVQPPEAHRSDKTWQNNQVFMAHMAITTPDDHISFQRYSRGGANGKTDRAGVTSNPFSAWLDDWTLQSTQTGWLPMEVKARQHDYAMHLQLESETPLVLQGDAGFSRKHENGGGSFYYSQPFLKASGDLLVDGHKIPVTGDAWLDREWSSQFLQEDQVGWDWFSLHLESGEKLVLFRLRQQSENSQDQGFLYGNLITTAGIATRLDPELVLLTALEETTLAGRSLPVRWRIDLPQIDRQLDIEALHTDQWMDVDFPYWEGAIVVNGNGPENRGRGYMELTGYPVLTKGK